MPLKFLRRLRDKIFGSSASGDGPSAAGLPTSSAERARTKRRRRRRRSRGPRKVRVDGPAARAATPSSPSSGTPWSRDLFFVPPEEGKLRFHDLNLPDDILHAIADLGFRYCTPIQAQALPLALAGRNVAGQAQTGTGKTAAFLISIFTRLLREATARASVGGSPRALVLAPTRELVLQIARDAVALGKYLPFRTVAVYGGTKRVQQQASLLRGPVDLVVATPGRLLDFQRSRVLRLDQVRILVIDEADRMLDMGFIPDVRIIVHSTPPRERRQTLLFSATLAPEVMALASAWMPDPVVVRTDPEELVVPTVTQRVYAVASRDKLKLLYHLLEREKMERVLVFTNRRDSAARLAHRLQRLGCSSALLSGEVPQRRRENILEAFRRGKIRVLVATDVAARGLHIEGITHVINYDFPYEPELYVHRIGRTGRVGQRGTAISFACENESFNIPAVENLLGYTLSCQVPDDELLADLPLPERRGGRTAETGEPGSSAEAGPSGPSQSAGRDREATDSRPAPPDS